MKSSCIFFLFVFFLLSLVFPIFLPVESVIIDIDKSFKGGSFIRELYPYGFFGFESGGVFESSLEINTPGRTVNLYLIPYAQWFRLEQAGFQDVWEESCSIIPAAAMFQIGEKRADFEKVVVMNDRYVPVIANCPHAQKVHIEGRLVLMNPGKEHLSLEEIPLLPITYVLIFFYVLLFMSGTIVVILGHRLRTVRKVHNLILWCIGMKTLEISVTYTVLLMVSRRGKVPGALRLFEKFCVVGSETMNLAMLLLVSMGWKIIRMSLTSREKRVFLFAFGLYGLFRTLFTLCDDPDQCSGYVLCYSVISFLITFGIIVSMNSSIERIRGMMNDMNGWHREQRILRAKLGQFKDFRWGFLAYLAFPVLIVFLEFVILTWRQAWLVFCLREILVYFILLFTGKTFRPRRYARGPGERIGVE
eukprot:TRINITY_DN71121_c0_g1_i1.p1 TRINITY_DN71121_c0_g1~~TRINITY_DN71121_c0_g1_i1.p1  ORF type:complete len:417 (-),score=68.62 TRINITY_DN71121_c0_g1_i1:46-1296(-)